MFCWEGWGGVVCCGWGSGLATGRNVCNAYKLSSKLAQIYGVKYSSSSSST